MTTETKKPWYKKWWAILLFIFFGIALIGNLADKPITSNTPVSEQTAIVFDLEALYGKNISEIREILGEPTDGKFTDPTPQQLKLGTKEWSNSFKKDKYELLVTYDVASGKVIDFFMATDDPSGKTKDTEKLERILNVENSTDYSVESVKTLVDPAYYTGLKASPR